MIEHVDPFIGSAVTDLPAPQGLAETWWWPKPQVGNTHPGATYPFGMVSACAYSGAYPTGYGLYQLNTEGVPPRALRRAARLRVHPLPAVRHRGHPQVLQLLPGHPDARAARCPRQHLAAARRAGLARLLRSHPGVGYPVRADRRSAQRGPPLHLPRAPRRPAGDRLLARRPGHPVRGHGPAAGPPRLDRTPGSPRARSWWRARRSRCTWSATPATGAQLLWYDRRLMPGGTRLDFDRIRPTTLRPFGLMWRGPAEPGQVVELRIGFSLRGVDQARKNLHADCGSGDVAFEARHAKTSTVWRQHLNKIDRSRPPRRAQDGLRHRALPLDDQALLRSGREPVLAQQRAVRVRHLHHVGHLPDPAAVDHRAVPAAGGGAGQRHGQHLRGGGQPAHRLPDGQGRRPLLPPGQRTGPDVPRRPVPARRDRVSTGTGRCATWTPTCAGRTARSSCSAGSPTRSPTPSTWRSATTARPRWRATVGDHAARQPVRGAGDPVGERLRPRPTGCCSTRPSTRAASGTTRSGCCTTCRPGSSSRAGTRAFSALLDRFFGYGADPVKQVGERPGVADLAAGYALNRFEGLNNEPDMDAPWAYHYVGRPDRTAEVVHAAVHNMFGLGRGGLPGNDDSGGLQLLVRLGLAGPLPGRRAEPVPGQRAFVRPVPDRARGRGAGHRDHRVRRARSPAVRCSTSSRPPSTSEPLDRAG